MRSPASTLQAQADSAQRSPGFVRVEDPAASRPTSHSQSVAAAFPAERTELVHRHTRLHDSQSPAPARAAGRPPSRVRPAARRAAKPADASRVREKQCESRESASSTATADTHAPTLRPRVLWAALSVAETRPATLPQDSLEQDGTGRYQPLGSKYSYSPPFPITHADRPKSALRQRHRLRAPGPTAAPAPTAIALGLSCPDANPQIAVACY